MNTSIEQLELQILPERWPLGAGVETGLSAPQIRLCSVHSQLCLRLKLISKDEQTSHYFAKFSPNFRTVVWLDKFLYVYFNNGNGFWKLFWCSCFTVLHEFFNSRAANFFKDKQTSLYFLSSFQFPMFHTTCR